MSLFVPYLNGNQVQASTQMITYTVTGETNNNPGFYLCRAPSGEVWSTYDDYYGTTTIDDDGSGYPVNERVTTRTTLTPPSGFGGNVNGENTRVNAQYVDNIELVTADPGNIQPAMNPNISGLNRTTHDVEITGNVGGDVIGNPYSCSNDLEGLFFEFPIEATWTGDINYTYSIELEPYYQSVGKGEATQFHAYVTTHYPDGSTNRSRVTNRSETTWDIANTSIASVDQTGIVTGMSKGQTEVSATFQDPNRGIDITATGIVDVEGEDPPPPTPSEPDPGTGSGSINAVAKGPSSIEVGQRLELDGNDSTSSGEIVEWKWYRYNNGDKTELNFYYDGVDTPDLVRTNTTRLVTPQNRTYLLEITDSNGNTDTDTHTVSIQEEVPDYVRADIRFEEEVLPNSVNITQEQYEADEEMTINLWVTAENSEYSRGNRAPMWFFSDTTLEDIEHSYPELHDDSYNHPNFVDFLNPPLSDDGLTPDWDDSTINMEFTFRPQSDPYVRAGLITRTSVSNIDLYDHDVAIWEVPIPSFPSLRIDPPEITVQSGETADYTAYYSPPDYSWEMTVDRNAEWTIEDETIARHVGEGEFEGLRPGTTTVKVEYSDEFDDVHGLTDTAILNVEVNPDMPVAKIDVPDPVYIGQEFSIDGSESYSTHGDITNYDWNINSSRRVNVEQNKPIIDVQYTYINGNDEEFVEVELEVTDEIEYTDTAAESFTILHPEPVAEIEIREMDDYRLIQHVTDHDDVLQGNRLDIFGEYHMNDNPYSDLESVKWVVFDEEGNVYESYAGELDGEASELYFDETGEFTVVLTVEETYGKAATDSITFNVIPDIPTAVIDIDQGTKKEYRRIDFSAYRSEGSSTGRYEVDHSLNEWRFTPIDHEGETKIYNPEPTKEIIQSLFTNEGDYTVELRVTNEVGNHSEWTETTINIVPDLPPSISLFTDSPVFREQSGDKAYLSAIVDADSIDGDEIENISWRYKYNANKDGAFDEVDWIPLPEYDDERSIQIPVTEEPIVGQYLIEVTVEEEYGQQTIINEYGEEICDETRCPRQSETDTETVGVDNIEPFVGFDNLMLRQNIQLVVIEGSELNIVNLEDLLQEHIRQRLIERNIVPSIEQYKE
ncbi:Ig-like domain-containing protein [Desertibacillus haloalkaliphilus]|nr:Ig-like domain-containing protein [Desertibacillus haloalkaliphilus]